MSSASGQTTAYVVTEKAGEWVAGKQVKPGQILNLTARQAEYELLLGVIEPAPVSASAAAKAKVEIVDRAVRRK